MKTNKNFLRQMLRCVLVVFVAMFCFNCAAKNISKDEIEVASVEDLKVSSELADKNAGENTKLVMDYLVNKVYGKKILTGVMDCAWSSSIDMDAKVQLDTGYQTALMGYDFMFATKEDSKNWYSPTQTEKAINWWLNGGLVTFTWHWLDPSAPSGSGASYKPEEMDFRIPYDETTGELKTSSKEFEFIKKDLDTIADRLSLMQELGVVVLWRPMHEACGNWGTAWGGKAWFWWGYSGPEAYKALYRYMFDYLTNEKELHNLIWVWNGQGKDWYPGDDVVDIVGHDIYDNNNKNGAGDSYYEKLIDWSNGTKMCAISECGYVPATESLLKSKSKWLYYMVWNDDDDLQDDTLDDNDNFWGGTKYNSIKARTTDSFLTDYQIKLGDEDLAELFMKIE